MYFLESKRLGLRPIAEGDINQNYVSWLNDPEVNQFSGRRFRPSTKEDIRQYLSSLEGESLVLAICLKDTGKHIGNIKYGPVDWFNRTCEIEILIGDKNEWGKGYASEAIYMVSKHLFLTVDMHRIEAKSANPAFIKAVTEKLGWTLEGEMRERFRIGAQYSGYYFMAILRNEFDVDVGYEL